MRLWSRCVYLSRGERLFSKRRPELFPRCNYSRLTSVPLQTPKHPLPLVKGKVIEKNLKNRIDAWIRPDSLQETLQAHRQANRDLLSRNRDHRGIPRHKRRNSDTGVNHNRGQDRASKNYKRLDIPSTNSVVKDYGGQGTLLLQEWKVPPALPRGLRYPWIQLLHQDDSTKHNVPAKQRLLDEMQAAQHYLRPTSDEDEAAQQVLASVERTLSKILESNEIAYKVIGSRATNTCGPLSDLDLTIQSPMKLDGTADHSIQTLRHVYRSLRYATSSGSTGDQLIIHKMRKGRVPVLDGEHIPSGLHIQMQCTNDDYDSIEITKAYLAEFKHLGQIYCIIRQMLTMRGLSQGMYGGISSYPLLHMIVASLKLEHHNTDPVSQLLGFLKLYSNLNFYTTAIEYSRTPGARNDSIASSASFNHDPLSLQPMLVPRKAEGPQYLMSLQDPANLDNDLGRSGVLIKHVQATCIEARIQIRAAMEEWDTMYERGLDMKAHGRPILAYCLEGNYTRFEEQRRKLRVFLSSTDSGKAAN